MAVESFRLGKGAKGGKGKELGKDGWIDAFIEER